MGQEQQEWAVQGWRVESCLTDAPDFYMGVGDSNSGPHAYITVATNFDFQPDFDTSKAHFGVCLSVWTIFRISRALIQV